MSITKNSVVEFHYTLSEAGEQIETSTKTEPLVYLHGQGSMLPGLENAIEGKNVGDKFEVTLTPEESYGERRDDAMQRIPLKHLQGAKVWKPGMTAIVESNQGRHQVTIVKVGRFNADCDLNHPFAGKTLTFAVEIVSVREATEEELSHGHVHGTGGCGH
ncbi:FKBP-type peptidyl-prolyl cis-trans isomerase [Pseudoalteromonas tunicata]|jgi:FKBP-type peptidyl-prolyl cis-trans isomerase SlyD|uniref:Peptidyl-prolyl cis-trans isomerase n=1 Tax=Pseudoalteromonas tunicata D2 TaxID=87626 RepID=A4C831_9GAMM|nr:peptidylprolyl isomerase [Pseudoalteromonas tunicata]ATC93252.1 FKBP-type peptidyl-prolyl cis-trans isomerase SlyD [Pseudoalteromonas tunicata]AXT32310.1 peptidylprolyl isomerase [Pseudoalteromonas tunicata]EAR28746.1 peptidyl-prolyl cis-trans isomerase, FkbP family protein [Pseudoalteromonas tunicata D2]MDP4985326.1 peptidylprolyl isomerase [Pseudoalteromonas tunicata]MDP5215189.1 peptidylprolyl isomerase [Pseudoalteromonas tunicata]